MDVFNVHIKTSPKYTNKQISISNKQTSNILI